MFTARLSLLTLSLLTLALTSCREQPKQSTVSATPETAPTTLRFQTDWFPQPEHGGYYQALHTGLYSKENLAVEILPGGPNAAVIQNVATGRAELGMKNGDDIIAAIARGIPVKIVAAEMQRDPQGILFHSEHPLRDIRDLDGKTIMAGAGSTWIQYMQKHHGIRFNLLPLVGDLARFMSDKTFIQQCFVTSEPYFVRERGASPGTLLIADSGYRPYRVIFASDEIIQKNPEAVRKFVHATIAGWQSYLSSDPAPAHQAIAKLRPDLPAPFYAYSIQAMRDFKLVTGDTAAGETIGQITRPRLQAQLDLLTEFGVLEKKLSVDDIARFDFLPTAAPETNQP